MGDGKFTFDICYCISSLATLMWNLSSVLYVYKLPYTVLCLANNVHLILDYWPPYALWRVSGSFDV